LNWKHWSTAAGIGVWVLGAAQNAAIAQEYEGPTILSRSAGGVRQRGERIGQDAHLRVFFSVSALYEGGLLPVSVDSKGALVNQGGQFGVEGLFGVYGTKRWKRSSVGLDYNGTYRNYTKNQYYNGSDNFLGLSYGNQLDRKSLVTAGLTAGTSSRVFSALGSLGSTSLTSILPADDIFDARTYFLFGGMGISRMESNRFGYEMRGDAFRVERHSKSLISAEGYSAKAAVSYRLDLRRRVGVNYAFTHFDYPKAFGEADIHSTTFFYNQQFNRLWSVQGEFGGYVASTAGAKLVALDPVISALLGMTSITQAYARTVVLPTGQVTLTGKTKNSGLALTAFRGPSAGNGVSIATSTESYSGNYSYVWSKQFTTTAQARYSRSSDLSNTAGTYTTYLAGVGAEYQTRSNLDFTLRGHFRRMNVAAFNVLGRNAFEVVLGVGWNSSDLGLFR
jgi:hypothetical protein